MFLEVYPHVLGVTTHKVCTKCGELKLATREYFSKRGNGLKAECKSCQSEYNKDWRADNLERAKARTKAWAAANPERVIAYRKAHHEAHREHDAAQNKAWREANAERKAVMDRAWYEANRERKSEYDKVYRVINTKRITENNKAYRAANPGKMRANGSRRKARVRNLPNAFTDSDWYSALDYFSDCCAACGQSLNGLFHTDHLDHWIPCASPDCPGTVPWNMVPLCSTCNRSKSDKPAAEWLVWKFGKRKGRVILKRIEAFLNSRRSAS